MRVATLRLSAHAPTTGSSLALVGHRGTSYSSNYREQLSVAPVGSRMDKRRNEIDNEIQHLRRLEGQMTDQKTLDGIKVLIADLEAERAALALDEKGASEGVSRNTRANSRQGGMGLGRSWPMSMGSAECVARSLAVR